GRPARRAAHDGARARAARAVHAGGAAAAPRGNPRALLVGARDGTNGASQARSHARWTPPVSGAGRARGVAPARADDARQDHRDGSARADRDRVRERRGARADHRVARRATLITSGAPRGARTRPSWPPIPPNVRRSSGNPPPASRGTLKAQE